MDDWANYKLGELIDVKYGKDHKNLIDGPYPVYGSGGLMRYAGQFLHDGESILIPRKGSLNNIFYKNEKFWTVDTMFWSIVDAAKAFPRFLYYNLKDLDWMGMNVGSAVPSLTVPVINDVDVLLPKLAEQKAIAEVLSSLDDKIDLLHRQNKTLESLAETLFRQWFIDGAQDGWETETLGSFITISSGKGFNRSDFDEAGAYKVLGANGEIGKCNAFNFDERLLFTGRVGTLGNIFIVNERVWLSDNTLVIRVPLPHNFYFVYFTLKLADLQSLNVGSTQPLIRQSEVKELEILAPEDGLLEQFDTICEVLFGKIEQNNRQINKQEELRDSLLPKLMSGDVRVDYEAAA